MKTIVLIVSRYFPVTHSRKGKPTYFVDKIDGWGKLHTIRKNYDLWAQRIEQVRKCEAIISLRYWDGKPYRSKQIEFLKLDCTSGVGVQKIEDPTNFVYAPIDGKTVNWEEVAANDGLLFDDFCEWFKQRQNKPMAIIHFTSFRY